MNKKIEGVRTWIEIDQKALENNYKIFRNLIKKDCKLLAVCKSNAYGHGLVEYAKIMEKFGADFLGVDSITEAERLRKEGVTLPILVLGYTLPKKIQSAADNDLSLTISSFESLKYITKLRDKKIKIHLKVDTGMHRQGFYLDEISSAIKFIKSNKNIIVEGIFTHFAAAKNPSFPGETRKQIEQFEKALKIVQDSGLNPIKHAAATGGTIVFPESHYDMVRIGIGLMGLWPSLETKSCYSEKIKLFPALSWKTIISEIKMVPKNEGISYDFTEKLSSDGKVGIVPIGYWHGLRRNLSSIGHVLVRGKRAKILGRVTMDMIMIDISNINAMVGDVVTIIGTDQKEKIDVYELAQLSETSWYETVTQLNPLIKKIYE